MLYVTKLHLHPIPFFLFFFFFLGGGGSRSWAFQDAAIWVCSPPMNKKKVESWHDTAYTCAMPASRVHDVTQDCQTQNGSAHGRGFATFKRRPLTNETINRHKNCCDCIFYFSYYSIPVDRTHGAPSLWVSFQATCSLLGPFPEVTTRSFSLWWKMDCIPL